MPTNSATGTAKGRENVPNVVCYIRKRLTFADAGATAGIPIEWLRQGSRILGTTVYVDTVFNAATTNVITVGFNSTAYDNLVNAAAVNEAATGITQNIPPTGTALLALTADSQLYIKYTQSGTAATTGDITVVVAFVNDKDR